MMATFFDVYLNGVELEHFTKLNAAISKAREVAALYPEALTQVRVYRDGVLREIALSLPARVDAVVSDWSPWIPTSDWEGDGDEESRIEQRTRRVLRAPEYGGEPAPSLWGVRRVTRSAGPTDCALSQWSAWQPVTPWSACVSNQQTRTEQRTRTVTTAPENGGAACGPLMEERTVTQACQPEGQAVNCVLTDWTEWRPVESWGECVNNIQTRQEASVRFVQTPPANGGAACGPLVQTRAVAQACDSPVNCIVSEWSAWMPIDNWGACINAQQFRTEARVRTVETPPGAGGQACGPLYETRIVAQACQNAHTASPDGTRAPPAPEIRDPYGAVYTLNGGQVHKDGQWHNGGTGDELLIWNQGLIYVHSANGHWYRDDNTQWTDVGTNDPEHGAPPPQIGSPEGTRVPPASEIIDRQGAVYTLNGGQVHKDGQWHNGATGDELLIWDQGSIYAHSPNGHWYRDDSTQWTDVGTDDPEHGAPPPQIGSPEGTRAPPASEIIDRQGAVYTLNGGQVHKDGQWHNGATGDELLIWNQGSIYAHSPNGHWYRDDSTQWTDVGTDDPEHGAAPPPSGLATQGRINAGTNELFVESLLDFKVGDKIITAIGREPGAGKRGTRGVGGNWPSDEHGFATLAAAKAHFGATPDGVFVFINAEGADFGKVFWGLPDGWLEMTYLNWSGLSNSGEYYNAMLTPRSLQAEIYAIDVAAKKLTLHRGPTNGYAKVSVQGAAVYKDMAPWVCEQLQKGSLKLPPGDIAIGSPLHITNVSGRVFEGAGKDQTRLFSPPGTPCLTLDVHNAPGTVVRGMTVQGNWRDHGFGHNYGDLFTPHWGAERYAPAVDNFNYQGGSGPTVGLRANNGSHDALFQDLITIDLATAHVGCAFSDRVWGIDITMRYTDPLRQYMQWAAGWNDTAGGGGRRILADFNYITPGFEAFKSNGVTFEDCGGRNVMLAMNSSSVTLKNYRVECDANALVPSNYGANIAQPLININTNVGAGWYEGQGVTISGMVLNQKGYVFQGNTSIIALKVQDRNPNVVVEGFENHAPNYKEGGYMHGAQAVDSAGPGFVVRDSTFYGKAYWTPQNEACNRAVVFTLNAGGARCNNLVLPDDPGSKFIW